MDWEDFVREGIRNGNSNFYSSWGFRVDSYKNDVIYKACIGDGIEYFNSIFKTTQMNKKEYRVRLTKEQKQRVVEFLKGRLTHYKSHGIVL